MEFLGCHRDSSIVMMGGRICLDSVTLDQGLATEEDLEIWFKPLKTFDKAAFINLLIKD